MWMDFVDPGLIFLYYLSIWYNHIFGIHIIPDHPKIVQKLTAEDHTARISFAEFILQKMAVDPNFLLDLLQWVELCLFIPPSRWKRASSEKMIFLRKFGSTAIFWRMNSAKEILAVWSSAVSFWTIWGWSGDDMDTKNMIISNAKVIQKNETSINKNPST